MYCRKIEFLLNISFVSKERDMLQSLYDNKLHWVLMIQIPSDF